MRRVELLVSDSRAETENEDFSNSTGYDDEVFIRLLNAGQRRIFSLAARTNTSSFEAEKIISAVAQQESYSLPSDIFLGSWVSSIEFSRDGNVKNYYKLEKGTKFDRCSGVYGSPCKYIKQGQNFLAAPVPPNASGSFRVCYNQAPRRLDKRRAQIDSVTTSGSSITALTLKTSVELDAENLELENYFCVVDKHGNQKMKAIPFTDIDDSTGVVTLEAGFEFESGESIAADDYIVRGEDTANISSLPTDFERYLIAFMNWKVFKLDSSSDALEAKDEVIAFENDLRDALEDDDGDVSYIPEVNEWD